MTLNDYQEKAMLTCMPSCNNFSYMMLNLVGEVGEFASKVAKSIRKQEVIVFNDKAFRTVQGTENAKLEETLLKAEAGDILWQLAGLCKVYGWSLEEVAQLNLAKLASRKQRGVIDGNGDER